MNRWLASRWIVAGFVLCVGSFVLDWYKGAATYAIVVGGFFALGGAKQWRDVRRRQLGEDPLPSDRPFPED